MKATRIPHRVTHQRRRTKATRRHLLRGILLTDTALHRRRRTRGTKGISTGATLLRLRRNTSSTATTIITITRVRMMAASLSSEAALVRYSAVVCWSSAASFDHEVMEGRRHDLFLKFVYI